MKYIVYIFWLVIGVAGVLFALKNSHSININYYFGSLKIYLPLLLIAELIVGALLGIIAMLPSVIRSKTINIRLRHHIKHIKQEVDTLRKIPIKDSH